MEKKKITRENLPVQEGKINVKFIDVDGKKIILTPVNHSDIRNYLTHDNCEECKKEFEKRFTYERFCFECQSKKLADTYNKMELVEWDGESALYLYDSNDQYFFDYSDIEDYCEQEKIELKDLRLVLCASTSFSAIDYETIEQESTHEDWEPSKEFKDKVTEFNNWLVNQSTNTWFPTNKRVDISSYQI